jgi:hypothetical protein
MLQHSTIGEGFAWPDKNLSSSNEYIFTEVESAEQCQFLVAAKRSALPQKTK